MAIDYIFVIFNVSTRLLLLDRLIAFGDRYTFCYKIQPTNKPQALPFPILPLTSSTQDIFKCHQFVQTQMDKVVDTNRLLV